MEQAALAFLPGITDEHEYQEYVKLLLGVGVFVGVTTSLLAAGVPSILPHLFTPDQRLWPIMKGMAPQVITATVLHLPAVLTSLEFMFTDAAGAV